MRIISWNVQGSKRAQVTQEILFLKRTYNPQMIFLSETLINQKHTLQILPSLGFEQFDYVEAVNHSRGLAVLWNNDHIYASVIRKEPRAIHMLVHDTKKQLNVIVSGIYAPAQQLDKDAFWSHLLQMNTVVDLPWGIIGDFNALANPSEKRGGRRCPPAQYERLNQFLQHINATSVPFTGYPFTWKKRIHSHLIYEQLDRAIVRHDWLQHYPDTIVTHGHFSCSNHCPIILTVRNPIRKGKKSSFRFQNFWCQYKPLHPIVRKQWLSQIQGTNMFTLAYKLKTTKHSVRIWARQFMGHNQQKLLHNSKKIGLVEDKLIDQPNSPRLNEWMTRLLKQREKLLLYNQKYLGNLRRKHWLVNGDRNSRFFQQQANTRRKKKLICKIKTDCNIWLDNPRDIADKFVHDFSARFHAGPGHHSSPNPGLHPCLSILDNHKLIEIPGIQEVKLALFAIDSSKTPGPDGFGAGFYKYYWDLIQQDVYNWITEFFRTGKLLKSLNHTFLALIPKCDNPTETHHF